ncbi:hypothetical protein L3X38_028085 [Prunus dulcis]|uniref:Protein kinase domain-containing protein n=1 Tax=Prunus dulcis TaxID=3755 RepID=A0AAD4Z1R1_PRUDU|nr:hypothetical protein L3X38_028085 [Prunus dulcis]
MPKSFCKAYRSWTRPAETQRKRCNPLSRLPGIEESQHLLPIMLPTKTGERREAICPRIRLVPEKATGSSRLKHVVASELSVRHLYEIAKVKQSDPYCQYLPLESICKSINAGKGTCSIPEQGDYSPLISAVHDASDTPATPGKKSRAGLIGCIAVPVGVVILLLLFAVLYVRRKTSEKDDDEDLLGLGLRPNTFSYAELRAATEDFNPSNKLGEGGYGPIYKGTLSDGRVVAVKQLSVASHQGKSQFVTEIATISAVQHRNLVKLYGCCIEGSHRILVYEYLENKSLDQALFGINDLHLGLPASIYCREQQEDLLTFMRSQSPGLDIETGYLVPEYAMRGRLTEKADVFGFGVVALEILSGRPNSENNLDPERIYLLEWHGLYMKTTRVWGWWIQD